MDYEKKYNEALERAKAYHRNELAGSRKEMVEYIFPQLRESEDEKLRKLVVDRIRTATEMTEGLRELLLDYLEKQKENPKSADSIPADCVSSAKCEDRWHKTANSLPDDGRDVLAKDALGNYLIASFDGAQWFVSVYDGQDHPVLHTPPILEWCEIPSEKQKEPENTSASTIIPSCWEVEQKEQNPISQEDFDTAKHEALWEEQKPADDTAFEKWLDDWYQGSKGISGYVVMNEAEFKNWSRGIKNMYQQKLDIALIQRSWYMEGYHDREFGKEPMWLVTTGEGGPKYKLNPKYGQPLAETQNPSWKPSEEHLSALLAVFNDPDNIGSQSCQLALTDLYEQLKKL